MKLFYILLCIFIVLSIFFIHPCDHLTGWGRGTQTTCECTGIKWLYENKLPVDGDNKSVCIGTVKSTQCFQYQGSEKIDCTN